MTTRASRPAAAAFAAVMLTLLTGCTVTLVQPYDAQLFADTEDFYKSAAGMIDAGQAVSPRTNEERSQIEEPSEHPAHYSRFEARYDGLIVDAEALILRAMASSQEIDPRGQQIQARISELIETEIPSQCQALALQFEQESLTVKNFVDLKCIVMRWKDQHQDEALTDGTMILKRANWEGRKRIIFSAVLEIQRAEAFKKTSQQ